MSMYRERCDDGLRCLHGCRKNERCFYPSPVQVRWISVAERIPQYQEGEDGLRVLVLTADHDFAGVQVHDIPASDFYAQSDDDDDEPGTEVTKVATHWMPRDALIAKATGSKTC